MSKSRGNFLDPHAVVAAFGADGVALRDPARGRLRPRHRRVVGLVRAPLQRGPRERLRQPREPHGLDGQPLPRRRAAGAPHRRETRRWPRAGPTRCGCTASGSTPACSTTRSASCGSSSRGANQTVDAEQPWTLNKQAKAGDEAAADAAPRRPRRPRRGVPARRAGGRAVHAGDGAADPRASSGTPSPTAPTATAARTSASSSRGAPRPTRAA